VIKNHIFEVAKEEGADLSLSEIGGTGDIENELFLESEADEGRCGQGISSIFISRTSRYPTGQEQSLNRHSKSVNLLKQRHFLTLSSAALQFLTKEIKTKISNFCDVDPEAVITGLDVKISMRSQLF
jgi:CTP synthase